MICPRCNSENIQIQVRTIKSPMVIGCVLVVGSLGLMFLGVLGVIVGVPIGLIVGLIVKAILPTPHESMAVCQNCGNIFNPSTQPVNITLPHAESTPTQNVDTMSNLVITREINSCGAAIGLQVNIDNSNHIVLNNGSTIAMKVYTGEHMLNYEQLSGIGKKKRTGTYRLLMITDVDKKINLAFTTKGLKITEV